MRAPCFILSRVPKDCTGWDAHRAPNGVLEAARWHIPILVLNTYLLDGAHLHS